MKFFGGVSTYHNMYIFEIETCSKQSLSFWKFPDFIAHLGFKEHQFKFPQKVWNNFRKRRRTEEIQEQEWYKKNGYYNLWGSAWLFNAKFVSYFIPSTHYIRLRGWWFSSGTPTYSTNKTDRHDIICYSAIRQGI
jgi:hypothetical protein